MLYQPVDVTFCRHFECHRSTKSSGYKQKLVIITAGAAMARNVIGAGHQHGGMENHCARNQGHLYHPGCCRVSTWGRAAGQQLGRSGAAHQVGNCCTQSCTLRPGACSLCVMPGHHRRMCTRPSRLLNQVGTCSRHRRWRQGGLSSVRGLYKRWWLPGVAAAAGPTVSRQARVQPP